MTSNFILAPDEKFIQCPYNTSHHVTNARFIRHLTKCREAYLKGLSSEQQKNAMRICRHNALHHIPFPEQRYHEDNCRSAHSVVSFLSYHNSAEGAKQYEERRKFEEESRKRKQSPSPPPSHSKHKKDSKRHLRDRSRDRDRSRERNRSRDRNNRSRERDRVRDPNHYSSYKEAPPKTDSINGTAWGLEEDDWEAGGTGNEPGYDPQIKLKREIIIQNPSGLTKSERKKFREEVRQRAADKTAEESGDRDYSQDTEFNPNVQRESGEVSEEDEERASSGPRGNAYPSQDAESVSSSDSRSHRTTPPSSSPSSAQRSTSQNDYGQHSSGYSSNSSKPSSSRSNIGSWYDKGRRDYDDDSDSDDFGGYDPYP